MTLFWALFGLAQPDDPTIPNSELYGNGHQLTSFVGHILFMVYFVVMGLVMLNMLIAMMSNSFQEIEVSQVLMFINDECFMIEKLQSGIMPLEIFPVIFCKKQSLYFIFIYSYERSLIQFLTDQNVIFHLVFVIIYSTKL